MNYLKIKPKLKRAYPVIFDKGRVIVGGFGKNTIYKDPSGSVASLFRLLTGENSIQEIQQNIVGNYPKFSANDVLDLINDLNAERFIEDSGQTGVEVLNEYERERYHRNINFFSSFIDLKHNKYKVQKKLLNTKIGIIGLGGLGSHIVYDLAAMGIGGIKAIEFDKVDLTDLNRQILYNYKDIGKSKGKLAGKRITEFNPEIDFKLFEHQVTSYQQIVDDFSDVDLIILVADRPKYLMARWANQAAVKLNVPMFCAGLESQRAMYYTIVPHKTGCVSCWRRSVEMHDHISDLVLKEKEKLNLVGDNTAIVPLVSAATGLVLAEILRYITGIGELQSAGHLIAIDFLTMTTRIIENWNRDPQCDICGLPSDQYE